MEFLKSFRNEETFNQICLWDNSVTINTLKLYLIALKQSWSFAIRTDAGKTENKNVMDLNKSDFRVTVISTKKQYCLPKKRYETN